VAQGNHENRIYELKMECGPNYPKEPPEIHFVSQINLPGVSPIDGKVDKNAVAILRDWSRIAAELAKNARPKEDPLSLEAALIAIRKYATVCSPAVGLLDADREPGTWTSTRSSRSPRKGPSIRYTDEDCENERDARPPSEQRCPSDVLAAGGGGGKLPEVRKPMVCEGLYDGQTQPHGAADDQMSIKSCITAHMLRHTMKFLVSSFERCITELLLNGFT
jgi:hypothetical protein